MAVKFCHLMLTEAEKQSMKWDNDTKLQHFVPQVEQRFNALNPEAFTKNQRIYTFEIVNRENLKLKLLNPSGQNISNTLAYYDLFSFDVEKDKQFRMSFESAFNRYERNIKTFTESLLFKLTSGQQNINVNEEIVNIFTAKLLNFTRNPFSIHKVLNTFGGLTNYVPALSEQQALFERILNGRKPHQAHLCQEFGISDSEYEQWLHMLFMLFIPSGDGDLNMLESIVKSNFIDHKHKIAVLVSMYTEPQCLLSDRSFSTNIDKLGVDGFDFNLSSRAFIRYLFADIDAIAPSCTQPEVLHAFKEENKKLPRQIQLNHCLNNMELLSGFNRNVVHQSYRHVYCASKEPLLLEA